jgi:hypothetical protein
MAGRRISLDGQGRLVILNRDPTDFDDVADLVIRADMGRPWRLSPPINHIAAGFRCARRAVDAEAQIIVAHDVTQSAGDCGQLIPMTDAIEINLGRKPEQLSAAAGYCSEANLSDRAPADQEPRL